MIIFACARVTHPKLPDPAEWRSCATSLIIFFLLGRNAPQAKTSINSAWRFNVYSFFVFKQKSLRGKNCTRMYRFNKCSGCCYVGTGFPCSLEVSTCCRQSGCRLCFLMTAKIIHRQMVHGLPIYTTMTYVTLKSIFDILGPKRIWTQLLPTSSAINYYA